METPETNRPLIREIAHGSDLYESARALREKILRKPLGLTTSSGDVDGEDTQTHIGVIDDGNNVVGTVTLKPLSTSLLKLRQMAIDGSLQGQGVGQHLITFAEGWARGAGYKAIEMTARVSAIGFYKKLGYEVEGAEFTEVTIPHIKMKKML